MRITLDLETNIITVPKNFFNDIERQNEMIVKAGGTPIKPMELIKKSFNLAMENTDKYLRTNSPKSRG